MNGQEGDAKTLPTIEESSSLKQQLEFRMYTRTQTWNEIHRDVLSSLQSCIITYKADIGPSEGTIL